MPVIVAFISQKGGVGKSTLARALTAVAAYDMRVRLADLDEQQSTVTEWERARKRNAAGPTCEVVAYSSADDAIAQSGDVELLIIDASAGADSDTLELARRSHVVIQPTGASADDLRPAVLLFHELVKAGVPRERLVSAICRVMSGTEEAAARAYMQAAGYEVLAGSIPERPTYREAQNRGAAITETKTATLNERADALMDALLRKITQVVKTRSKAARGAKRGTTRRRRRLPSANSRMSGAGLESTTCLVRMTRRTR